MTQEERVALIEDGLEGEWLDETTGQILSFFKPETSGEWGVLQMKDAPNKIEYVTLEYKVIHEIENIVTNVIDIFIDVRVKTVDQILQYKLHTLNSWQGILYIDEPNGAKSNYNRTSPRQIPQA